jgi:hypothetical protein
LALLALDRFSSAHGRDYAELQRRHQGLAWRLTCEFGLSNKLTDDLTGGLTRNLFLSGGISAAIHNGPLRKDKQGCNAKSDCEFGYRVLPRLNIELGTYFREKHGLSLVYDHKSHKHALPGENEGIDHIGIRCHFRFNAPQS